MKKAFPFTFLIHLFLLQILPLSLFAGISFGAQVNIFGPNQYVRTKGKPNIYKDTFYATPGDARLIIKNGIKEGKHRINRAVSSAVLLVNEKQIFGPNDFNKNIYTLETSINLNKHNSISIKLAGKPNSCLSIEIKQKSFPPTVNITANPEAIYKGESSTLSWSSTNADIVYIDNAVGDVSPSGSITIYPAKTTTYTITAKSSGSAETATAAVTLKVIHVSPPSEGTFGKQYEELIPEDVTIEKYNEKRFCIITGFVYTKDIEGERLPLSDVTISLHNHPEYGTTKTNEQGRFAIPADGGGIYTIVYQKQGYIRSQRQIRTFWSEVVLIKNDPVLIKKDPKTTKVFFDGNPETIILHKSTPVSDERGTRSCTLIFTGDNNAYTTDGKELTTITISVTEYDTPDSMPAMLPPYTIYTYCAEFSAEEAEDVLFQKPVTAYIEDFLNIGTGGIIPVGYYDRNRALWTASKNGIVVTLLDTDSDGIVDSLDADGDAIPDDIDNSGSFKDDALGLDNKGYQPNTIYWRIKMDHFSPGDFNFFPSDKEYPPPEPPGCADIDTQVPKDCKNNPGSYIEHRSRILHQDIPIQGTDLTLHYSTHRTGGHKYKITVPVTGAQRPPCNAISVCVETAGRRFKESFIPAPNQKSEFIWDGLDFLGKQVYGKVPVNIDITYHYSIGAYLVPVVNRFRDIPPELLSLEGSLFGWPGAGYWTSKPGEVGFRQVPSMGPTRGFIFLKSLDRRYYINVQRKPKEDIAEGWTISAHHSLVRDPIALCALYKGDGTFIENQKIINTMAGTGYGSYNGDDIPAIQAQLNEPSALAVDSKGNLYILDGRNKRIRKVDTYGIITTIAGGGWDTNDGIPATQAQLYKPADIAVDNEGNLYIIDNNRLRKVDTKGIITTILNTDGKIGYYGDGGPAIQAWLRFPTSIACDSNGNIYLSDSGNNRIRMINTNGIINTIAGNGIADYSGDGGPAILASITPYSIDIDSKGNIYILDSGSKRIRKVSPGGTITTFLDLNLPHLTFVTYKIDIDSQDNLHFTDLHGCKIKMVNKNGEIVTLVGNGDHNHTGDEGAPLNASFNPMDVAVDPRGDIYIVDWWHNRVRKISRSFLLTKGAGIQMSYDTSNPDILVPDENGTGYIMTTKGRHQATIDLDTGKPLIFFGYDNNRLTSITDRFGNETKINRDLSGTPLSITSPEGMVTTLTIDMNNHLRCVTYQDDSHYDFDYTPNGLMTDKYEPNGNHFVYEFDTEGKITDVFDPEGGHWIYHRTIDPIGDIWAFFTTPEGNTTTYHDHISSTGFYTSLITGPTNDVTTFQRSSDNLQVTKTLPCGSILHFNYKIDPKCRIAYISKSIETSPSGLIKTTLTQKAYEDTDGDNLKEIITTTTINNKEFVMVDNTNKGVETFTSPEGRSLTTHYNPDTLLTESMNVPGLFDTTYEYNTQGRLTSIDSNTRNTTFSYDSQGFLESITDPENHITTHTFDTLGRIIQINQPDDSSIRFTYDQNGNTILLTTPSIIDHGFGYNGVNLNTSYQTPISGSYSYIYDKDRRLVETNFPSGKKISHIYNMTRLVKIKTPKGDIDFTYLCGNKVESITRGTESIAFGYDGRLITKETLAGTISETLSYTYNSHFNLTSFTYAGGTIDYSYDKDQLLTGAGRFTITRNVQNGMPEVVTDSTLNLTLTFNGYGEEEGQDLTINGKNITSWNLSRDNSGRITAKSETIFGATSDYQYTYDPMGRLLSVTKDETLVEEYQYGPNGTRTYEINVLRGISGRDFAYSDEDHLLSSGTTTYQYDLDGFLAEKREGEDVTQYDYSIRGELLRVDLPDGRVIEYIHDPMGRRIAKKVNGLITEKYLWQGLTRLLAVYDPSDNLLIRFEYADARMPVAMTKGGSTYYLSYDQVGSLRIVIDETGNVVKRIDYDSFGNIIYDSNPTFNVPLGFAGGLHDRDIGLVRFGFRDYDPDTGRWTAKDPLFFEGGSNYLYEYCFNDPVNWFDPKGESLVLRVV